MGKWTRRGFIAAGVVSGGALMVGVGIREGHRAPKLAELVTEDGETLVNVWVKLSADNTITAIVPHSEMGQGVFTSMTQMLADEMDADWDMVTYEQAPAHEGYANYPLGREFLMGDTKVPGFVQDSLNGGFLRIAQSMGLQITGGSTAIRFTGMGGMRIAGAAAREMIVKAAAKTWDVPVKELRTEKSYVYHDASGRSEPYASFAVLAGKYSPPTQPKLKSPDEFKLMGTSLQRFDIPSKTDGTAEFGIDVDLPDMKYAAVMGPPVLGAEVERVDETYAADMPGVIKILNKGSFVAVVADGYWQAENAVRQLDLTWTKTGAETLNQSDIYAMLGAAIDAADGKGSEDVAVGNARQATGTAARVYEAEYRVPFLAHAAMEPINATAWVRDGKIDFWSGLQNPLAVRDELAGAFDVKKHDVTIHNVMLGGGFGRRSEPDYPLMAVEIAKEFDHPVKMIWSREQDTQQDWYRPASVSRFKAGLDDQGMPVSWENMFVQKHDPPEASHIPYKIDNQLIQYTDAEHHMRFGPWRSVDHTQHGFFIESFIDELADQAGMDGYAYRRKLVEHNPRYLTVLDAAADAAGWGREVPEGRGLGIALVDSFGTVVAQVVEVDVTGPEPKVVHVWCAADPGYVMNPDGFTAQIESGIIYGLTAALYGNITIEQGAVVQSNFHDYPMLRMRDAPEITVKLINSGAKVGGGGEPGTPPIAPALANAVFAATGVRVRSQPIANFQEGLS
ncbi:MAG: xanthine dehydrogenase family protein molybdopterin-binding subunit [Henriciella sp.]|nr:xanthine dehydrogenase family protein molybdopterin-binding subunit [Henriciella sp.]